MFRRKNKYWDHKEPIGPKRATLSQVNDILIQLLKDNQAISNSMIDEYKEIVVGAKEVIASKDKVIVLTKESKVAEKIELLVDLADTLNSMANNVRYNNRHNNQLSEGRAIGLESARDILMSEVMEIKLEN